MLPAPPEHSLDPTDWRTYCDLLQDADAPRDLWRRAGRIADSLARDPKLVLINHCPAEHLAGHWLRVGRTWFIGAPLTVIETSQLAWWRPEWVRAGFASYPTRDPKRNIDDLLALNYGTPWELPHPRFDALRAAGRQVALVAAFFDTHGLDDIPPEYL